MSKITKSAQGQECQIRIPHICSGDNETTVFAHLNGYGMGGKHSDLFGSYSCDKCHSAIDYRVRTQLYTRDELLMMHYEGCFRTQQILLDEGLIKLEE